MARSRTLTVPGPVPPSLTLSITAALGSHSAQQERCLSRNPSVSSDRTPWPPPEPSEWLGDVMPSPARPELHAHLDARAGQLWPALGALGSGRMFTRGERKSHAERDPWALAAHSGAAVKGTWAAGRPTGSWWHSEGYRVARWSWSLPQGICKNPEVSCCFLVRMVTAFGEGV